MVFQLFHNNCKVLQWGWVEALNQFSRMNSWSGGWPKWVRIWEVKDLGCLLRSSRMWRREIIWDKLSFTYVTLKKLRPTFSFCVVHPAVLDMGLRQMKGQWNPISWYQQQSSLYCYPTPDSDPAAAEIQLTGEKTFRIASVAMQSFALCNIPAWSSWIYFSAKSNAKSWRVHCTMSTKQTTLQHSSCLGGTGPQRWTLQRWSLHSKSPAFVKSIKRVAGIGT